MADTAQLGSKVKDVVSGLTGIVTGKIEYWGGETQLEVTSSTLAEGKTVTEWIRVNRLELLDPQ